MMKSETQQDPNAVAIVTGAADGIGWAVAQCLAGAGYRLVLVDMRAGAVQARVRELPGEHLGLVADVTSEEQVRSVVLQTLARWGRVDALVNNAGIAEQARPTLEQDIDAFDRLLQVHVRGTFLFSREVAAVMRKQRRGAIVNLSSIAAFVGLPGRNAYAAAKAGISAMTRSMACEWARWGLRVNAVAPGYVRTQLVENIAAQGLIDLTKIAARTPLGRLAEPHEIADVIAYLLSDRASYITGTTVHADGGWVAFGAADGALPPLDEEPA